MRLVGFGLALVVCGLPAPVHPQQPPQNASKESGQPGTHATPALAAEQPPEPQGLGSIRGTVVDPNGAALDDVHVRLMRDDSSPQQETVTGADGRFAFGSVAPGPFHLLLEAQGFATQNSSGTLHPGEDVQVPPVTLPISPAMTQVSVVLPREELAEIEVKAEEKQRALGFIPNFYVTYDPDAASLTAKQKFELAWRTTIDPISLAGVAFFAGVEQAQNYFSGYGQGAQGYGKRFGAGMADASTSALIGGALLPTLLKQDPRYFYKGTGSFRSRFFYAVANAVICKGDNGHWQPNYSGILGGMAAGGISNLYYPPKDRGVGLTFLNSGIGIGEAAIGNLLEEFVVRRLTPNLPKRSAAAPKS